jgi:hypothetical protein
VEFGELAADLVAGIRPITLKQMGAKSHNVSNGGSCAEDLQLHLTPQQSRSSRNEVSGETPGQSR